MWENTTMRERLRLGVLVKLVTKINLKQGAFLFLFWLNATESFLCIPVQWGGKSSFLPLNHDRPAFIWQYISEASTVVCWQEQDILGMSKQPFDKKVWVIWLSKTTSPAFCFDWLLRLTMIRHRTSFLRTESLPVDSHKGIRTHGLHIENPQCRPFAFRWLIV